MRGAAGFLLLLLLAGCVGPQQYYIAPTLTPGTVPAMNTPGYWIGKLAEPDRLLMTADEIDSLNARVRTELKTVADIGAYPATLQGAALRRELQGTWAEMARQELWCGDDGAVTDDAFYAAIAQTMNIAAIPDTVTTRFALVTAYADQRVLPTDEVLCAEPGDVNFDELQNSAYDIGTPLAVVHASADGRWLYAVAPLSNGWIAADRVAFCTRAELHSYLAMGPRVVATAAKADMYSDRALRIPYHSIRLGTWLPSGKATGVLTGAALAEWQDMTILTVTVPMRMTDGTMQLTRKFMRRDEGHEDFLPLTSRSLIQTAFTMLNTPYGWGDMYGEQDCSRFIQQVFAVHGVQFPRNSTAQGQVGTALPLTRETPAEEKNTLLAMRGIGGATVLELNGHIMLYLGSVDGKPFVIHDIWGYRTPSPTGDVVHAINKVAVTSLELGRGSRRGALIERIRTARQIP
ncbi:MAG TPA: SH3 domain-containing protein [bacterium]|nr:SH3 domain-containing protein [bacterium]